MDTRSSAAPRGQGAAAQLRLELEADHRSPGRARRATTIALRRWRLLALTDAVVLAVSELVTNAVRHGLPPVRLILSRRPDSLLVEVHDEAHELLARPDGPVADGAESGRGMGIVDELASDSGVEQISGDGKVVFAVFRLPPAAL